MLTNTHEYAILKLLVRISHGKKVERMTDSNKLQEAIDNSGYTIKFIAKRLGITPQGFYKKRNGSSEFTIDEMLILCELLKITKSEREEIFLT